MSISTMWGTTAEERARVFPCDGLIAGGAQALFRGVSIEAPPAVVFRWLCQLRVAPYSYDWIDNFGRRSPKHLTERLEDLAQGQSIMRIFRLVSFERDRHITVVLRRGRWLFGDLAVSYVVEPAEADTKLIVKLEVRYPRGPFGWLMRAILPWGDLIMMRRQLLNLKALAEQTAQRTAA